MSRQASENKKKSPKRILILIGTLLLINAIALAIMKYSHSGLLALGLIAAGFILYGLSWEKVRKAKLLHIIVIAFCLILIIFSGALAVYGHKDNAEFSEDAAIVLGAGIRGEQVSRTLAHRLDKAVEYHQKNPAALIVVTGGQGVNESIPEALAMERYLIERGVPAGQIIKEDKSTTTYENFLFAGELLRQEFPQGFSSVFITNDFHVYRAERIAQNAGISAKHMGAGLDWYSVSVNYLREMMAVVNFWLFTPDQ